MSDGGVDGGSLFDDGELEQAFGTELGAGPGHSDAGAEVQDQDPPAETHHASIVVPEKSPTWAEFENGWHIGLYRDPVLCGVFAGVVLGVLGVFVVLRRAIFVTAAVSQGAALGVAVAFLIQIRLGTEVPPVVGALGMALVVTAVLTLRTERLRLPRETLVGLTYLAASAAAVLVGDRITQESHDIAAILFGTAVLVRPVDLMLVEFVGSGVLLVALASYRGFLFAGFDPEGARVVGVPVRLLDLLLWVLVAVEVSVATRAIGALPVFAFAVLPGMAALALVERIRWGLLLAALIGATAGGLGYLFAFFFEFPVGASQATLATLILLVCLAIARLRRGRT
ncbi:MAG: metal ABC transporter permease [Myxococcales bacterium]|nr:metal ABC transporter permease [Myxococcales bacterium]MCB9580854.1 metal ABC transporter permease [Polyangiaceae bacterium]